MAEDKSKKGMIGCDFFVSSEQGKYLVLLEPDKVVFLDDENLDHYKVVVMASIFKYNFNGKVALQDLVSEEDMSIQIQLDRGLFTKEVQLVVDSDKSVSYEVKEGELSKEDEITKYVPRLILKEGHNED
jgi:hypothetical protein